MSRILTDNANGSASTITSAQFIDGSADTIQLRVQGNGTQTTNIFQLENSAATILGSVTNAGLWTIGNNGSVQTHIINGSMSYTGDATFATGKGIESTSAASTLNVGTTANTTILNLGTSTATQTVNIGNNAGTTTTINIGGTGDNVVIAGTLTTVNTVNLDVTDKLITLNDGGTVTSGNDVGIQVEENAVNTGYVKTGNSRNSWEFKAPALSGTIRLTPGSAAVTTNLTSTASGTDKTLTLPDVTGTLVVSASPTFTGTVTLPSGSITSSTWTAGPNSATAGTYLTVGGTSADNAGNDLVTLSSVNTGTTARNTISGVSGGTLRWRIGSSRGTNLVAGAAANDLVISTNSLGLWFSGDNGTTSHGSMTSAGLWTFGPANGTQAHTFQSTNLNINAGTGTSSALLFFKTGTTTSDWRIGANEAGPGGAGGFFIYTGTGATNYVGGASTAGAWTFGPASFVGVHTIRGNDIAFNAGSNASDLSMAFSATKNWVLRNVASDSSFLFRQATDNIQAGFISSTGAWTLGPNSSTNTNAIINGALSTTKGIVGLNPSSIATGNIGEKVTSTSTTTSVSISGGNFLSTNIRQITLTPGIYVLTARILPPAVTGIVNRFRAYLSAGTATYSINGFEGDTWMPVSGSVCVFAPSGTIAVTSGGTINLTIDSLSGSLSGGPYTFSHFFDAVRIQ